MQYMLLIYNDENAWAALSDEQRGAIVGDYLAFTDAIRESGNYVSGGPLHPTSTATAVRLRDGQAMVTDGRFAETKEQLDSYYRLSSKGLTGFGVSDVGLVDFAAVRSS